MSKNNEYVNLLFNTEVMSPMHSAIEDDNLDEVTALLVQGRKILHVCNLLGLSPLHYAVQLRRRRIVEFLLSEHLNESVTDAWGFNNLHAAAMLGDHIIVRDYLKQAVDVNMYVTERKTLQSSEALRMIINSRAHQAANSWPVKLNSYWGVDIAQEPFLTIEYWPGYTPLHFAVENRNFLVFELLLANNANPNAQNHAGLTPLHMACALSNRLSLSYVVKLLAAGADPNVRNVSGETPVHVAIQRGNVHVIQALFRRSKIKVNPGMVNENKETYMHILANRPKIASPNMVEVLDEYDEKIYHLLYQYECPVNQPGGQNNQAPILLACLNKMIRLTTIFLEYRFDVETHEAAKMFKTKMLNSTLLDFVLHKKSFPLECLQSEPFLLFIEKDLDIEFPLLGFLVKDVFQKSLKKHESSIVEGRIPRKGWLDFLSWGNKEVQPVLEDDEEKERTVYYRYMWDL